MKTKTIILLLFLLGLFLNFYRIQKPNYLIFDEKYFAVFASDYFINRQYFDIHPPFPKLAIAFSAKIFNYDDYLKDNPAIEREDKNFGKAPLVGFRFFPSLLGSLLPVLIFLIAQKLGFKKIFSLTAALIIAFENSLIIQSSFALIDIFMIFFGLLSFYFILLFKQTETSKFFIFSLISIAFSISSKWTGMAYFATILLVLFLERKKYLKNPKVFFKGVALIIIIPISIYILVFFIHFSILKNGAPPPFNTWFDVNASYKRGFAGYFLETNQRMTQYNSHLNIEHEAASSPLEWLNMEKMILYYKALDKNQASTILFFGNPLVWLLGVIGLISLILFNKKQGLSKNNQKIIIFAYLISYLPFFLIQRKMFLYSYLTALIFSIFIFMSFFKGIVENLEPKKKKIAISSLLVLIIISFLYFSPLVYGNYIETKKVQKKLELLKKL